MKVLTIIMVLTIGLFPGVAWADEMAAKAEEPKILGVGDTVKALPVPDLDGNPVDLLKEIKDKAVISIMNTSCSACQAELRFLDDLMQDLDGQLLIVSVDMTAARLGFYLEKNMIKNGTMYHDPIFSIGPMFGFSYTPAMIVIDKSGKVLWMSGGWNSRYEEIYTKQLKEIL